MRNQGLIRGTTRTDWSTIPSIELKSPVTNSPLHTRKEVKKKKGKKKQKMASTEGLVPITRNFLASYYDKYPAPPLSDDVSRLSSQIRSLANDLLLDSPPSQGFLSVFRFISAECRCISHFDLR